MIAGSTLWRGLAVIALVALVAALVLLARRTKKPASASFIDHVEDLRQRILVSAASLLATAAFLFSFDWAPGKVYPVPALHENLASRLFLRVRDDLVPDTVSLVVARPMDGFAAEMTIAIGLAVVLTSPILVWQMGGFIWPALHRKEQRLLIQMFVPVVLLFLAGAAFAYLFVLPFLLETLYDYGAALGAQGLLPVSEFVTFVLTMVVIMGFAFQTPIVMWLLTRVELVPAATWLRYWRHAIVGIFILSALVTDPTIISQVMVAAPLMVLYGLGIALAKGAELRASS